MGVKTRKLGNIVDQIVEWQSVVVADGSTNTTGVSGRGYFIDTSAGAHTINLPTSPKIGDVIRVSLITAGNDLTIGRNGNNINGGTNDLTTSADGDAFELVYVNASEGWKTVGQISAATFISATGGTVTESGNFKIHKFTGDGCFVVSSLGNNDSNPLGGPNVVDYLVVAGGGGGGGVCGGGGGGAGGFRESHSTPVSGCYTASPLATPTGITVTETTYPITVGAGGAAGVSPNDNPGDSGSNSVFSTITSTGGGGGNSFIPDGPAGSGGSGGGGGGRGGDAGGSGNTPPVSPPQGNNGGNAAPSSSPPTIDSGGGGGGATAAGQNAGNTCAGNGGNGAATEITASPVTYSGGGGGGSEAGPIGTGGNGGGGAGATSANTASAGTANTGGGGGGTGCNASGAGAGGKGIVIIRYKFQ